MTLGLSPSNRDWDDVDWGANKIEAKIPTITATYTEDNKYAIVINKQYGILGEHFNSKEELVLKYPKAEFIVT